MNSLLHCDDTSIVELTKLSSRSEELFMSYKDYPWFKGQAIKSIVSRP